MSSLPFQTCAITGLDGVLGYAQSFHFLTRLHEEFGDNKFEVRLLCRTRSGLDELEKMGGRVIQTDYRNKKELVEHLSGVDYVLFVPEMTETMLIDGISVIEAAKRASVKYIAMYSSLGVHGILQTERPMDLDSFRSLYCLESVMAKQFGDDQRCVFRIPFIAQMFYLLMVWVEEENKLYMPMSPGRRFAVVDMEDVLRAVFNLSVCVPGRPEDNRTLFEFTPSQRCMTPDEMATAMTHGLGRTQEISYQTIDSRRLRKDLQEIRKRKQFNEHLPSRELFAHPLGVYLTNDMIDHLLDLWELAEEGHLDRVTNDLQMALGKDHPPKELEEFFKANRGNFEHFK
ncbi:hypothetical protein BX666DRAFT_2023334 [Dichotomocladium elegans]|nr:hypothetical protein BX666DRAFT_2023334 [Dichotomocladium elegans]